MLNLLKRILGIKTDSELKASQTPTVQQSDDFDIEIEVVEIKDTGDTPEALEKNNGNESPHLPIAEFVPVQEPIKHKYEDLPPYNPVLDLRSYTYPNSDLLEESHRQYLEQLVSTVPSPTLPVLWSTGDNTTLKDLTDLNSILITGTQETGKSTFLHQLVISLLLTKHPSQVKFVLIDPKKIELNAYRHIENHFLAKLPGEEDAVVNKIRNVILTLNALCIELDNRFELFKEGGARNIREYNERFVNRRLNPQKGHQYLPYIILIIDDLAGYINESKKDVYLPLERLIKDGYRTGIINIISTSQSSGEVTIHLTRLITQKVVFRLNSKDEFKKFFDTVRIDKNLTKGQFLFNDNGNILKGATKEFGYNELEKVVDYISDQRGYPQAFMLPEYLDEKELEARAFDLLDKDPLFEDAAKLIISNQIGSTSLLQRKMKLGYNRAGRLIDQLEAAGIVGPDLGSKTREVLVKTEADLIEILETLG